MVLGGHDPAMFYRFSPELVLRSRWRPYRARPGGAGAGAPATGSVFPPGHPATRLCLDLPAGSSWRPGGCPRGRGCWTWGLRFGGAAAGGRSSGRPALFSGVGVDLSWRAGLVATARNNARANGLAAGAQVVRGSTEGLQGKLPGVTLANLPWGGARSAKVPELTRLAGPAAPA